MSNIDDLKRSNEWALAKIVDLVKALNANITLLQEAQKIVKEQGDIINKQQELLDQYYHMVQDQGEELRRLRLLVSN